MYLALLVYLEVYFSLFVICLFTIKKIIIVVLNFSGLKGFLPFTLPVHSPVP